MYTDEIINAMVSEAMRPESTDRERHVFRETLQSLVNLAKIEAVEEMRKTVQQHLANPASLH
jgi:hypothetical protein